MRIVFFLSLAGLLLAGQALAQAAPAHTRLSPATQAGAPPVACKANKMFSCGPSGCEVEDHPSGLPVEFDLKGAEGQGYLCTYTYCRSFTLMGWRGRPKGTGLTWSSASGSTPPLDKTPEYDFHLTMAEDWKSFTLAGIGNGGVSGYTGQCTRPDGR